ncbi:MAG TPA: Stk1 family PASTA domain-containing Ser/Thr kinase [Bacillales bacterium]|nr:Stk1 family PASTA domain-containing Ser/Thr kinase [Bacillales bacterium]
MIGKRVGDRYELISVIGGGGMALVYKARDLILDRYVAVKVLRSEFSDDEDFIRRFRREARSVATLSHANVVNIFDIGDDSENVYYIVMEYVEGETLKDLIKREAPLSVGQALWIMDQVTSAIEHAHEHDIVHRDIKPHNILLDLRGNVKVTDFGIALAASSATITHTNSVLGSAHYFSPEQARGAYADTKSDIYSLGIVLFEMLTGELPFSGTSPVSVALKHLQEDIPDPREINPAIPQSVENIVLKALAKDPAHRYDKVEAMREDLKTALDPDRLNEPKYSVPDDGEQTTKVMPPVVASASGSGAGGSGSTGSMDSGGSGGDGNKPAKYKGKAKKTIFAVILGLLLLGGAAVAALGIIPDLLYVEDVKVPKVVGMNIEKARELIKEKQLKVDTEKVYSTEYEKDEVTKQNPASGTMLKKGRTVHLFVSKGPEKIVLENYIGKNKDTVELLVSGERFRNVDFRGVYDSHYAKGEVFDQEPDAGTTVVPENTKLVLFYSKGPQPVGVPDLSGMTREEAENAIMEQSLVPNFQGSEYSDTVPEGTVLTQSPEPGTELTKGDEVEFTVSKGPKPDPEEPFTFKQPITVEGPDQGKPIDVKIVYSDANHDKAVFVEEKLKDTKTYELTMTVNPDGSITIWVYENGKLHQTIKKSYDQITKETSDN